MSKLIIFDGDGTLWNSYDAYLYGITRVLEKEGIEVTSTDITGEMMAKGIAFTLTKFQSKANDILNKRLEVGDLALDYMAAHNNEIVCPGAPEVLHRAKVANKKFALVTNSSPQVTDWILKNTLLLNSEFDEILPQKKESKKERITKLMKTTLIAPEDTEMIDDTIHGMQIANSLNCKGTLVLHKQSWQHKAPDEEPPKNIKIIYSLDEINFD